MVIEKALLLPERPQPALSSLDLTHAGPSYNRALIRLPWSTPQLPPLLFGSSLADHLDSSQHPVWPACTSQMLSLMPSCN